eukprot:m.227735 g.227735  ORF g.227735 m.227735 type:complete len:88 (+) comp15667_c0_seq1:2035-2298(+)
MASDCWSILTCSRLNFAVRVQGPSIVGTASRISRKLVMVTLPQHNPRIQPSAETLLWQTTQLTVDVMTTMTALHGTLNKTISVSTEE